MASTRGAPSIQDQARPTSAVPGDFLQRLDDDNNEADVRSRLETGKYNAQHAREARYWLQCKVDERQRAAEASHLARADAALSEARRSNSLAREANEAAFAAAAAAETANALARAANLESRRSNWIAAIALIVAMIAVVVNKM